MNEDIARDKFQEQAGNKPSEQDLKELASQLGKPEGEKGIQIGVMMNETNISMTRKTWEDLSIHDNDRILELGHGNANHLKELLNLAGNLQYSGLDISELMKQEAEKYSVENGLDKKASFQLYDGTNIPFADNSFDKIFTVNTIYFWQQPVELLNELKRVLKPDGILCITLVDQETMDLFPFTEYGFTKYTESSFRNLVKTCQLTLSKNTKHSEWISNKMLGEIERKFWVMELSKSH